MLVSGFTQPQEQYIVGVPAQTQPFVINVYHHWDGGQIVFGNNGHIEEMLRKLLHNQGIIMETLDDIVNEVAAEKTVVDSAITLLNGLKTKLDEAIAANDPAKLQAISDALGANSKSLADAVAANTPVAPPVTPPVVTHNSGDPVLDDAGNPVLDANGNPTFWP